MKTKTDETWYTDLMSLKQLQSLWGNRVLLFGTHCCAVSVLGFVWKYFFFVFSYLLQTLPNRVILTGCRLTIKSDLKEKDSLLPWAFSFLQCFLLYINLGLLLCCSRGFDVPFVYRSKLYLFRGVSWGFPVALPLLVVMKTETDETCSRLLVFCV